MTINGISRSSLPNHHCKLANIGHSTISFKVLFSIQNIKVRMKTTMVPSSFKWKRTLVWNCVVLCVKHFPFYFSDIRVAWKFFFKYKSYFTSLSDTLNAFVWLEMRTFFNRLRKDAIWTKTKRNACVSIPSLILKPTF